MTSTSASTDAPIGRVSDPTGRRRGPRSGPAIAAVTVLAALLGGCTDDSAWEPSAEPTGYAQQEPPGDPAQTIDRSDVETAIAEFGPIAEAALAETGVPGMAIGVVFDDEVVWTEGFGVREVGSSDPVDASTVFQLASLSKPVGSTVVAGLVGDGVLGWDDPIVTHDPDFALSDPWVSEHVTVADMYSHRSGLPEHAGDLLEDLGFSRAEVLRRLRLEPLDDFRSSYAYTNFGLTEGALAAANAAGAEWEDLSEEVLYEPLGMEHTSSRFSDYMAEANRAVPHMRDDQGEWVAEQQRQPDAQTPAGGVSSNVEDMTQWLRLQLGNGSVDGVQIVDGDALTQTHVPHGLSGQPRTPSSRVGTYGLGWNVSTDDSGRQRWGHSGAFLLGAATTVSVIPSEHLAVVVLTNGQPIGLSETMVETFLDLALEGEVTRDWYGLYGPRFASMLEPEQSADWATPPADAVSAAPAQDYIGTYTSEYYGPLEIRSVDGGSVDGGSVDAALEVVIGPAGQTSALTHYDGDTFWFVPSGENGGMPTGITFERSPDDTVDTVTVEYLDTNGLGSFTRA